MRSDRTISLPVALLLGVVFILVINWGLGYPPIAVLMLTLAAGILLADIVRNDKRRGGASWFFAGAALLILGVYVWEWLS